MANKPKSMLQIRRILQLASSGESIREIHRLTKAHRETITNYLHQAQSTGKGYEELLSLKDAELAEVIYPNKEEQEPDERLVNFLCEAKQYRHDLIHCKGMTRKRLWERHLSKYPSLLGRWKCQQQAQLQRLVHPRGTGPGGVYMAEHLVRELLILPDRLRAGRRLSLFRPLLCGCRK